MYATLEWVISRGVQEPIGAIDVIAIQKEDGTISCSPFHVRFSKLAKRGSNNIVKLMVNGTPSNISMKLGSMGEVFFVEKTKERVKKLYRTSPCVSPLNSTSKKKYSLETDLETNSTSLRRIRSFSAGDLASEALNTKHVPSNLSNLSHSLFEQENAVSSTSDILTSINSVPLSSSLTASRKFCSRERSFSEGQDLLSADISALDIHPHSQSVQKSLDIQSNSLSSNLNQSSQPATAEGSSNSSEIMMGTHNNNNNNNNNSSINKSQASPQSNSIWTWTWGALPMKSKESKESKKTETSKTVDDSTEIKKSHSNDLIPADASIMLSFCGHLLNQTSSNEASETPPQNPGEMLKLLQKYRLGSKLSRKEIRGYENFLTERDIVSGFSFCESWLITMPQAIIENPKLVIVIDDFILPGIVGFQILRMIYQSNHSMNVESSDFYISRPLSEDSITHFLREKCIIDNISLSFFPRWFGKKVTQWDSSNNGSISISISMPNSQHLHQHQHQHHLNYNETTLAASSSSSPEPFGTYTNSILIPEQDYSNRSETKISSQMSVSNLEKRRWSSFIDLGGHLNFNLIENSPNPDPNPEAGPTPSSDDLAPNSSEKYWEDIDDSIEIDNISVDNRHSALKSPDLNPFEEVNEDENTSTFIPINDSISYKMNDIISDNSYVLNLKPSSENLPLEEGGDGDGDEEFDTDAEVVSLEDTELSLLSLDDISPEPARGDIYESDSESYHSLSLEDGEQGLGGGGGLDTVKKYRYRKSLVPTQEQLLSLNLKKGENELIFHLQGSPPLKSHLYVWSENAKVVVSDIEGAISVTKSIGGVLGFFKTRQAAHDGVSQLLNNIYKNGYHILYIATNSQQKQMTYTRDHLMEVTGSDCKLPLGPIFQSPESLIRAFGIERTDIFKAAALRGVSGLFPESKNPFYAGFGTRKNDLVVYSRCGISKGRIYLVNSLGEVQGTYFSSRKTFQEIDKDVDHLFPPLQPSKLNEDSYGDFNYWKIPIREIKL